MPWGKRRSKKWQDGEKIRNKKARINKNARKMYIKLKKAERKKKAYKTERKRKCVLLQKITNSP